MPHVRPCILLSLQYICQMPYSKKTQRWHNQNNFISRNNPSNFIKKPVSACPPPLSTRFLRALLIQTGFDFKINRGNILSRALPRGAEVVLAFYFWYITIWTWIRSFVTQLKKKITLIQWPESPVLILHCLCIEISVADINFLCCCRRYNFHTWFRSHQIQRLRISFCLTCTVYQKAAILHTSFYRILKT